MNVRQELESWLCEPLGETQVREHAAFARVAGTKQAIVIFGAGRLGRSVLQGLSRAKVELIALSGAWSIVQEHRPVLAICAYHRQDHIWNVPRLLHLMLPDAAIFMRGRRSDGFDVVCYAVPPERANRKNQSAAHHSPNLLPLASL